MKLLIACFLLFLACSPKEGAHQIAEQGKTWEATHNNGRFLVRPYGMSFKTETLWKWQENRVEPDPKFYFSSLKNSHMRLHVNLIAQDEAKFAENLTKLQNTYSHILQKWVFLEESIKRLIGKKTYYLKFSHYDEKNNQHLLTAVYTIQITAHTLATFTITGPETSSDLIAETQEDFKASLNLENVHFIYNSPQASKEKE